MRLSPRASTALLLAPALVVVAVFLGTGVVQAVLQSFGYQPYLPGTGLSLDAYRALGTDPAVRASLVLTARIAGVSTVAAAVLGVAAALAIRRLGRGQRWVTGAFTANLAVPHVVGALCVLLLLGQSGFVSRLGAGLGLVGAPADFPALTNDAFGWGIVAEYVWKEAPFLTVLALAALNRGADELADAARTLGAGRVQRLRHVSLPLLVPAVGAGSVLVLAFTAGSYEVPRLLGQPFPATLPVVALEAYRNPDLAQRPVAMAVAVLITVLTTVVVLVYLAVVGRLGRSA